MTVSQENLEIVRGLYEAFNHADFDSMLDEAHPDIELDASERLPDEGSETAGPIGSRSSPIGTTPCWRWDCSDRRP